ncbi:MAG TPA: peptide chain release factor N(5)-glutamine methyltransferase [Clostridia bacterium]|nr:peptide chain release factor N(5)-glutamine methyltransferase [Clostridia bacterium]
MNVIKIMNQAQSLLHEAGVQSDQLESGVMMAHLLDCQRAYLYVDRDRVLSPVQVDQYLNMVHKRCQGVPLHYIIGYREFMGLDFYVDKNVLIPRPDTETLVEFAIEHVKNNYDTGIKILDIGTGSGAIAISLAKFIDGSSVTAVDIDTNAIKVALKNAIAHGVEDRVTFIEGDLLGPFMDSTEDYRFDVLVSNPPYIPSHDIEELESQVKDHEPFRALDGGEDGLSFYRRLAKEAIPFLKKGGLWAVEVAYNQSHQVAHILQETGCYKDICYIQDLSGYNRVVGAILKEHIYSEEEE